jgi:hypothetical protein
MSNPNTMQEFNLLNETIYENNLLLQLTNYRPLGNRHDKVKNTVISGYYKLMLFTTKPAVIAKAQNTINIQ